MGWITFFLRLSDDSRSLATSSSSSSACFRFKGELRLMEVAFALNGLRMGKGIVVRTGVGMLTSDERLRFLLGVACWELRGLQVGSCLFRLVGCS